VVKKADPFITTLSADTGTGLGGGEGATYLSQVTEQEREAFSPAPQVEMQLAFGDIATHLQLDPGAQVISRHQKRYIDGTPWSMQTSFYPRGLAAQGADRLFEPADIKEGTVRYLAETLGLKQVGYRDWITVRTPNEIEAEFFKLPQDGRVGVYEVFRTAFDQTGTPMRLTITIFPTDRNQFIVNDGQVPPLQPHRGASTKKSLANPLPAVMPPLTVSLRWRPQLGSYIGADQVLCLVLAHDGVHFPPVAQARRSCLAWVGHTGNDQRPRALSDFPEPILPPPAA